MRLPWRRTRPAGADDSYSLRRRLISTTLGSSIAVGLISTIIVLALAWKEVSDTFDDSLEEGARLVLALGEGTSVGGMPARDREAAQPSLRLDYQIVSRDGVVLRRGEDAPRRPFVDPGRKDDRFYDVRVDGERWRVYVRKHDALDFSVQIGQEWDDRSDLIVDMLASLAWPLVGLWLLLGVMNWWLIRRLLAPLENMARGMEDKSPSDLSPLVYDGRAREVQTVVTALNRLLGRLDHALEGERRFTADAAHELRTPLAALASRIQVMQRTLAADSPAAAQLQRLREDVARSTALVENLLHLARLDPESPDALRTEAIDAPALLEELVRVCAPAAAAREVSVTVACQVAMVTGNRDGLVMALRNLLHNAISYGRRGGRVEISATQAAAGVVLAVRDDGEGVSQADRERLTQRFFRILGNEVQGSGLGLSIVARVAELHRATLRFEEGLEGRGLGVLLHLP
ncbi:ATP-binding protein [Orrella dioscoreae]|uniref:histidine kinase n=1 Tax=Orrella dioscoreae TaxID=1851544 RepID=A0A1C3JWH6_9BURK|nr:ATP-binding protein [Orrella dioscoreae]SBT23555.1 possible two component system response sensor kinase membrane-associated protein PhoR [Orrella dioscoreae]SOE51623.1 possible two component system response sensor kinase membrane-associated protein PhoR [Orrella dioscoreae]